VTKALDAETKAEAAGFETKAKTEAAASETEAKTEAVYLEAEAQGSWPILLPHDARSASVVLLSCVVRPSVCPWRDVPWAYRLD